MGTSKTEIQTQKIVRVAIAIIAIAMVFYHVVSVFYVFITPTQYQNLHLIFSLSLVFLVGIRGEKKLRQQFHLILFLILSLACTLYVYVNEEHLINGHLHPPVEVVILGTLLIFLCLEACRRSFGLALPIVILVFFLYALFGQYLPGIFRAPPYPIDGIIGRISIGSLGVYGIYSDILTLSANVIFPFILLGSFLQVLGATRFFLQLGRLAGKKLAGGSAMTAVVSSAAIGSISGSAVANVVTTGAFTIPAMKAAGYRPEEAAAIEAAASNGGQIMPPVMGVVAFLMAAMTGISYREIIVMALIPAILYFFSIGLYVRFRALRKKIKASVEEVDYKDMLLSAPLFVIPLGLLIFLLAKGYSLGYCASVALFVLAAVSIIRKETRPSLPDLLRGFDNAAVYGAQIGVTMASIGILLGSLSFTLLVIKIPGIVGFLSGGNTLLGLILTMFASIIIGCSVSSIAAYVLVAVAACPALVEMGLTIGQAHLFAFYFGVMGLVTPPVAVAALVASRLAGAPFMQTAIEASKAAIAGFIIPYFMVWAPVIILQPAGDWIWATITLLGSVASIIALQVVICGYYLTDIGGWEKGVFAIPPLLVFLSLPGQNSSMMGAGVILFVLATVRHWWRRKKLVS